MKYKTLTTSIIETANPTEVEFENRNYLDEAPLIMADRDIFKTITNELEKVFSKMVDKNPEKALVLMKQLGTIVGWGVTKTNQAKGKSFRYELKKK